MRPASMAWRLTRGSFPASTASKCPPLLRSPHGCRAPACGRARCGCAGASSCTLQDAGPVVLLLTDGAPALMIGANAEHNVVFLQGSPRAAGESPLAVDELRLEQVWSGEAVLLRAQRGQPEADAPFTLGWLSGFVLREKPVAPRYRPCLADAELSDDLSAVAGHDGGRQGADAP